MVVEWLQSLDPEFESMSRQDLVALGQDVCILLDSGESVDSVTEAYMTLYAGSPQTVSRLVVAADTYLC